MTDPSDRPLPRIIQGGMGISISNWRLAQAVSRAGQLGVLSGTAIELVITCRLQEGDPGGHIRRILGTFPNQALANEVLKTWYQPKGLPGPGRYRRVPMYSHKSNPKLQALTVVSAFAETALAKEGHDHEVGINLLAKIQPPTLPVLYGAMLAGVDWVLMGAGIPRDLPLQVERLSHHLRCEQRIELGDGKHLELEFDPASIGCTDRSLCKPKCVAILSSDVLATSLARSGGFAGFVVENWRAGGHNAPPRGSGNDAVDAPVYGPRDDADLSKLRNLGLPFWLAGAHGKPGSLKEALALGASGIQVGTAFAFCEESGMDVPLRSETVRAVRRRSVAVTTEGRASPTGFPFKIANTAGTEGDRPADARTRRRCVIGYLRHAVRREDGSVLWRCPAEPVDDWVRKGGARDATEGRRCICHGLLATAGYAHATPDGELERPLVTAGDDLAGISRFFHPSKDSYAVQDVLDLLLDAR
ncbi:MAG: nitronate monooxygenase [Planctomycetes bacterium]|nr:nitronate monooxygenase [Planctomycetota bacterium]